MTFIFHCQYSFQESHLFPFNLRTKNFHGKTDWRCKHLGRDTRTAYQAGMGNSQRVENYLTVYLNKNHLVFSIDENYSLPLKLHCQNGRQNCMMPKSNTLFGLSSNLGRQGIGVSRHIMHYTWKLLFEVSCNFYFSMNCLPTRSCTLVQNLYFTVL